MGQQMCGGRREDDARIIDIGIFDKSIVYCGLKENSPYYKKKIRRAERRVKNAKIQYEN